MKKAKLGNQPAGILPISGPSAGRNRRRTRVDTSVGQRLREARLLAGLSQAQLGARIGVSFQAVQKYESGENRLSASRLLAVAEFLGRPVSFFFNEFAPDVPAANQDGLSAKEIRLVRYYRGIAREEVRDRLLKLVRSISETNAVASDVGLDDRSG